MPANERGSMACHYTYDKIAGKVLIPNCYRVMMSNDIEDCTCLRIKNTDRKEIADFKKQLKELQEENKKLKSPATDGQ